LFFVDAFIADTSEEVVIGFAGAGFGIDTVDETLIDRELDGDRVEAPFFGITVVENFGDDLVKESVEAAMGGNDGELAAPSGYRFSDFVEETLVLVECKLVELDVATFASESVWI
jgi:hypothetical protein